MKYPILYGIIAIALLSACNKSSLTTDAVIPEKGPTSANPQFVQYLIRQGNQYCDQNLYTQVSVDEMKFVVKFDSSAIYQTINSANQVDINKLYGFADNNMDHHQYSARFGWRWKSNQLQIFAYIYNNGVMSFQQLGDIAIGTENTCSIKVLQGYYVFTLNNVSFSIPRASTTTKGVGYKLYPFFGGTETTPHDIKIWIKDL